MLISLSFLLAVVSQVVVGNPSLGSFAGHYPASKSLESPCHLMLRTERLEDGGERDAIACQLVESDIPDGEFIRIVTLDGIEMNDDIKMKAADNSYVLFADADIDYQANTLQIKSRNTLQVTKLNPSVSQATVLHRNGRKLQFQPNQSTSENVLVVRVETPSGSTSVSEEKLGNDWFTDDYSLATQYTRCSRSQLNFQPAVGSDKNGKSIKGGVYTLRSPSDLPNGDPFSSDSMVLNALEEKFNTDTFEEFDKIAICLPSYSFGAGVAYAYINSDVSVYNDVWCQFVSSQMHELAHNLGLGHAGRGEEFGCRISPHCQYDDRSGLMGISYPRDDMGICFNGAKSWQLGWFRKYHKVINSEQGVSWTGNLYGFYVLEKSPNDATAIVRIECPQAYYYIHFNHVSTGQGNEVAPNYSSVDGMNKVMVTRTDTTNGFSQSWWEYEVDRYSEISIQNIGGSKRTLVVKVGNIDKAAGSASVTLVLVSGPTALPTATPTDRPTKSPTKIPTSAPTALPTIRPTKHPTFSPTAAPTEEPTNFPTKIPTRAPTALPTTLPTSRPTRHPTMNPTVAPTEEPTKSPTKVPTSAPTALPTPRPTPRPTKHPTSNPTGAPTDEPTKSPTKVPTSAPTSLPTSKPTKRPTSNPTVTPTEEPTKSLTNVPTSAPTALPISQPTAQLTLRPTAAPTEQSTKSLTKLPTPAPTALPTSRSTNRTTLSPTDKPTDEPTKSPTKSPTPAPTSRLTNHPTSKPTEFPTKFPTLYPTRQPTKSPSGRSNGPSSPPSKIPSDGPTFEPSAPLTSTPVVTPSEEPSHGKPSVDLSVKPKDTPTCNFNALCEDGEDCESCPSDCRSGTGGRRNSNPFCCAGGSISSCFPRGGRNDCFKKGRFCQFGFFP